MEVAVQLVEGFVELATQLGEGPSKPKILAWRRQSGPIWNFQPLLLGLRPGRYEIVACSPRLDEQLAPIRLHSQKSLTLEGS